MTISSQFNLVQNVFTLNMFSNFASGKSGTETELTKDLDTILTALLNDPDLQQTIGVWEVVWGPVVGSYGSDVKNKQASNAMYVAKQGNQYVVAVSATNPTSLYGWFVEDFKVNSIVPWSTVSPTTHAGSYVYVSQGTSICVDHLLQMGWFENGDVIPTSLMEFLKATFSTSNEPAHLVVSGHSLGGALSPTLALYIAEQQQTWNPAQTVVVSTMPTAGATPGNQAFSNYQNSVMGLRTLRFWNKLDPVPHGWQPDMVEMVPFLYYPYIKPGVLFKAIAGLVLEQSLQGSAQVPQGGFYTPLQPQAPPLPGQVNLDYSGNLSASQVLQMLVDIGVEELLAPFHKISLLVPLIVDAVNWALKTFDNQKDLDNLFQEIENKVSHWHDSAEVKEIISILSAISAQLENVMLYLLQLAFQHVTSYPYLMGTSSIHELTQGIINNLVLKLRLNNSYTNLVDNMSNPVLLVSEMAGALSVAIPHVLKNDAELVENIVQRHKMGVV
jgi:hypothetical protein